MSCIEISILWLSISVCRPEASPRRAPGMCSSHRSSRIEDAAGSRMKRSRVPARPEEEAALRHLERARERLRAEEEEIAEVLRMVR